MGDLGVEPCTTTYRSKRVARARPTWAASLDRGSLRDLRLGTQSVRRGKYWSVNAFHVLGALFALWAITLAALGITRENFPRSGGQALAVGGLSVLLAVAAIGSAWTFLT